jgi:hypothetical protein
MEETTPTPVTTTSLDIFTILRSVVLKEPHPIDPIESSSHPSEAVPKTIKYHFSSLTIKSLLKRNDKRARILYA